MANEIVLDGEASLDIPIEGVAGIVIDVGHDTGIDTIVFNADYTLTFNMTNGETFTTGSIRGEQGQAGAKGDDYVLTQTDKQEIAGLVDAPVDDVRINGQSIVQDGVANMPIGNGIKIANGAVSIAPATNAQIKQGIGDYNPIVSATQDKAVFYGLAKASGDTTQSQSSNPVGTYTEEAKSAISDMLNGSVSVSGTTPTIVAKSGIRYICGEVATLDFTPPASGICDVVFTSGSTPTALTVPSTVKWANNFDPTSLEANTTYEINVMDGLGVVGAWI